MNLKLLAFLSVTMLTASGCTIHFPLSENQPSLTSQSDSDAAAETSNMSVAPTAPNTIDPVKGNTAETSSPTPGTPR